MSTKKTVLWSSVVLFLALVSVLAFYSLRNRVADHLVPFLLARGSQMSPQDADKLERELGSDPSSFAKRIELLCYYSFRAADGITPDELAKRRGHVLWVIQHEPGSKFAGGPEAAFTAATEDQEGSERGKTAWMQQVNSHPKDARILFNAGRFLWWGNDEGSQDLLERAYALSPGDYEIASSLAGVYWKSARHASTSDQVRQMAAKSLTVYESALGAAHSARERLYDLPEAAQAALEAGNEASASRYADEALSIAREPEFQNSNDDAIHYSNIVLGRISLKRGDVASASTYLEKAGAIRGNPHLSTFGPNMMLAKELVEKGETKPVLKYIDLCSKFWTEDEGRLKEWRIALSNGKTPDFGPNLHY